MASTKDVDQLKIVPVETLSSPSIQAIKEPQTVNYTTEDSWRTPIIQYLKDKMLPEDKRKARLLRLKVERYTVYDDQLHKRGFSTSLLKCVDLERGNCILQEIYEEICRQSLAYKGSRQGYFRPTMKTDAMNITRKCDNCKRFSSINRSHPEKLTSMTSPWSFTVWRIDLIDPMPTARPTFKYVVVAVDHFTKWAEGKPLATISSKKVQEFFWESIIYRFKIPHEIVLDNGTQFDSNKFLAFCDDFRIKKSFSLVDHPQTNSQVECKQNHQTQPKEEA